MSVGNLVAMRRTQFTEDHDLFRESFRTFVEREMTPHHLEWNEAGVVPRELFATAGAAGFLGMAVPEEYGGGGVDDFRYNQVIGEELQYAGVGAAGLGMTLHTDICLPYFLSLATDEQRTRWLPGIVAGELITAIGMTEPGIGSDLASMSTSAIRDGDHYVVNGAKTFITNGINADLVITAVKTDPAQRHAGMSLLVVERGMAGFERGRNLEKVGSARAGHRRAVLHRRARAGRRTCWASRARASPTWSTTCRRSDSRSRWPASPRPRPRSGWTLDYVKERQAFGSPIASFQNTRFALAEMRTEVDIAQVFVDRCVEALNAGELTVEEAAEAKWWCTELQKRTVDRCVQLHGGYGYMLEYPIARAYIDARVTTIYGGTTEIMKEIIGRKLTRG